MMYCTAYRFYPPVGQSFLGLSHAAEPLPYLIDAARRFRQAWIATTPTDTVWPVEIIHLPIAQRFQRTYRGVEEGWQQLWHISYDVRRAHAAISIYEMFPAADLGSTISDIINEIRAGTYTIDGDDQDLFINMNWGI